MRFLDRLQPLALLVLRVVLGVVMIAHGYGKVSGGLSHYVQFIASLGLPSWLAYLSATAEVLGGVLVIAGVLTRFVSLTILVDLCVAIWKVDGKHGLLHGYELTLSLAAIAFALIFFGAGPIALDALRSGGGGKAKPAKFNSGR